MTAGTTPRVQTAERIGFWALRAITYLLYAYILLVEAILLMGFLLLLLGANPSAGIVEWIYRSTERAMDPFRGIFEPVELGLTGNDVEAVLDPSILFAMVMYGLLAALISMAINWLTGRIQGIDRRNQQLAAAAEARRRQQLALVAGECRWLNDWAGLDLAAGEPAQLSATWSALRPRVAENEANIAGLGQVDGEVLRPQLIALGSAVGGLRSALDSYVRVRLTPDVGQPHIEQEAANAVTAARVQLTAALSPFTTGAVY